MHKNWVYKAKLVRIRIGHIIDNRRVVSKWSHVLYNSNSSTLLMCVWFINAGPKYTSEEYCYILTVLKDTEMYHNSYYTVHPVFHYSTVVPDVILIIQLQ